VSLVEAKELFVQEEYKSWMGLILQYLERGDLPLDQKAMTKLVKEVAQFTLLDNKLYKWGLAPIY